MENKLDQSFYEGYGGVSEYLRQTHLPKEMTPYQKLERQRRLAEGKNKSTKLTDFARR